MKRRSSLSLPCATNGIASRSINLETLLGHGRPLEADAETRRLTLPMFFARRRVPWGRTVLARVIVAGRLPQFLYSTRPIGQSAGVSPLWLDAWPDSEIGRRSDLPGGRDPAGNDFTVVSFGFFPRVWGSSSSGFCFYEPRGIRVVASGQSRAWR